MSEKFMPATIFCKHVGTDMETLKKAQEEGFIEPHHISPAGRKFYSQTEVEAWEKYKHRYDNYYDTKQAAKAVGVTESTIARWRRENLLTPAFRANNKCYYTQDQIDAIINPEKG